jgi:hypothetical protein
MNENHLETNMIPERLSPKKEESIVKKIRQKLAVVDGEAKGIEFIEIDEINGDHTEYFIIKSIKNKTRRCFPKRKGIEESIIEYIDELANGQAEEAI